MKHEQIIEALFLVGAVSLAIAGLLLLLTVVFAIAKAIL